MELRTPFAEHDGQIAIDLPGARALFTTRAWGDVRDTEQQIAQRLALQVVRPRQVHGNTVIIAIGQHSPIEEADAVVTATPGVGPMVITADCLPIVIASASAVATVHAGWRGLDAGIIANAVATLRELGGGVMHAAIGPGAGVCCYEVGEDLHRRFNAHCQDFHRGPNLDLKAIARVQLMEAGVARIHDTELCTICGDPELTYSYRREGAETGRQAAIAWLS
ncbi:MAG TPA: peptidoglycan editing factor PgeF [Solirubrobacteraceae bacterium]|nr:peptidoglycan editing factor PgeF [Solirubrobacteraceae bacterium]